MRNMNLGSPSREASSAPIGQNLLTGKLDSGLGLRLAGGELE